MNKSDIRPGRWVRVFYSDVGAKDGIVLEKDKSDSYAIFFPFQGFDCVERHIQYSQIIEVGNYVKPTFSSK